MFRFLLVAVFLLPFSAHADFENVRAAVELDDFETELRFEDGTTSERQFRRAGIEYWEGVTEQIQLGFALGYSDSEGREPARPFETVSGNFGALGLRIDAPLSDALSFRGRAEYLLQRDRRETADFEFETRTRESSAELGPVLHAQRMEFFFGARWRDLDYRDIVRDEAGDAVRHAEGLDDAGAFAAVGLYTDNDGIITFRYQAGATDGWSLRFERAF